MDTPTQVYRASAWRWIFWLVLGGLLSAAIAKSAANAAGPPLGTYIAAVLTLGVFLLIAFMVGRSNIVIENGCIQHRTILGTQSPRVELGKLTTFRTYKRSLTLSRRDTMMWLEDANGNTLKARLRSRILGRGHGGSGYLFVRIPMLLSALQISANLAGAKVETTDGLDPNEVRKVF